MAANKKNAKSTKTAHVLNLLAGPGGEADTAPAAEGETPETAAAPQSARPLTPPILEVARSNDEQLSGQILQALEEELTAEPAAPAEAPVQTEEAPAAAALTAEESPSEEPAAESPSAEPTEALPAEESPAEEEIPAAALAVETPARAVEEAVARVLAEEPESQVELPHQDSADLPPEAMADIEPEPVPAPERSYDLPVTMMENPPVLTHGEDDGDPNDEDLNYVNVMQILVEEKAPRYIEMFGLCPCRRCAVDVKALTLSNLVPKYVVMRKAEMIPMLTIYEGRYSSTIFAQLTRACKLVMDHPHHGRD